MAHNIEKLNAVGQSVWLDYISRGLLQSGGLETMVRDRIVQGVTSNPTIFNKAVSESSDYDASIGELAKREGMNGYEAFLHFGAEDIRAAADVLRPVYDATAGADGFVSFEAQAAGAEEMLAEARRMFALVDRPNVMIKIPGVPEGVSTVEELIAEGINVNVTLLFSVEVYAGFADAYIRGLQRRRAAGERLDTVAGVASFFVSRVDTKVDARLPEGSPLRGKIAIANAWHAYEVFEKMFGGERWEPLAAAGARVQRPLWASTGTKNPAYSDILYVDELVAPHTVNTLPEPTLRAFLDHGRVEDQSAAGMKKARATLDEAAAAGIDIEQVAAELLDEGLASFKKDFDALLGAIEKKLRS